MARWAWLDGIVLGVEPSAAASCRGGRCGRRPGRTSTTWVLRLPANSRDPSRAFSPASGLALGGGSEREVAGSEEPVLGDHAVTGGPDIRDVGAHLPLGDDVSLVPSSAPASAGSGCQGVPRPTRDAVSREAQRLAVGSAGADLEAVLRCWFPSGSRRRGCRMTRRRGTSGARRGPRRRGRGRRLGAFRAAARRESRPVLFGSAIELGPSRRRSTDRQHRGAAGREADEVPAVGGGHRDVR